MRLSEGMNVTLVAPQILKTGLAATAEQPRESRAAIVRAGNTWCRDSGLTFRLLRCVILVWVWYTRTTSAWILAGAFIFGHATIPRFVAAESEILGIAASPK